MDSQTEARTLLIQHEAYLKTFSNSFSCVNFSVFEEVLLIGIVSEHFLSHGGFSIDNHPVSKPNSSSLVETDDFTCLGKVVTGGKRFANEAWETITKEFKHRLYSSKMFALEFHQKQSIEALENITSQELSQAYKSYKNKYKFNNDKLNHVLHTYQEKNIFGLHCFFELWQKTIGKDVWENIEMPIEFSFYELNNSMVENWTFLQDSFLVASMFERFLYFGSIGKRSDECWSTIQAIYQFSFTRLLSQVLYGYFPQLNPNCVPSRYRARLTSFVCLLKTEVVQLKSIIEKNFNSNVETFVRRRSAKQLQSRLLLLFKKSLSGLKQYFAFHDFIRSLFFAKSEVSAIGSTTLEKPAFLSHPELKSNHQTLFTKMDFLRMMSKNYNNHETLSLDESNPKVLSLLVKQGAKRSKEIQENSELYEQQTKKSKTSNKPEGTPNRIFSNVVDQKMYIELQASATNINQIAWNTLVQHLYHQEFIKMLRLRNMVHSLENLQRSCLISRGFPNQLESVSSPDAFASILSQAWHCEQNAPVVVAKSKENVEKNGSNSNSDMGAHEQGD